MSSAEIDRFGLIALRRGRRIGASDAIGEFRRNQQLKEANMTFQRDWTSDSKALIICAVVSAFAVPSAATAQSCQEYGWRAVQQTIEYNRLKCSGGDPSWWSEDINYHKDWCDRKTADPAGVGGPMPADGNRMRQEVLDKCQGRGSDYCDYYADTAVRQSDEFVALNCSALLPANAQGLPEWWNSNPPYHANWCNGLAPGSPLPQQGINDRENVLIQCRAAAGTASSNPPPIRTGNFEINLFAHLGEVRIGSRDAVSIGWTGSPAFPLTLTLTADPSQPVPQGLPSSYAYRINGGPGSILISDAIRCDGSMTAPVTARYQAILEDSRGYKTAIQPTSWTCVP